MIWAARSYYYGKWTAHIIMVDKWINNS
jgi:hypothetical protein